MDKAARRKGEGAVYRVKRTAHFGDRETRHSCSKSNLVRSPKRCRRDSFTRLPSDIVSGPFLSLFLGAASFARAENREMWETHLVESTSEQR